MEHDPLPLVDEISGLIREKLLMQVSSPEQDLLETGLLDSLTLVQLLLELESRFGVAIPLEELEIDDFRTLTSIARLIESRRTAARSNVNSASESQSDGKQERRHSAPAA